jgi:ABC-type transport system involved in multi-copper enzyme maturation permease subunit
MDSHVDFPRVVLHRTLNLLLSLRGLIALAFAVFMLLAGAFFLDAFMQQGTVFGELMDLFLAKPDFKFQWIFFDSALSKLVTLFVAPLFVFDAVSGDKSGERIGLLLSRPLSRTQYMLVNLASATLAFGTVFFSVMLPGYFLIRQGVPQLTIEAYLATCVLMFLLGFFTICLVLLISTLSKRNIVSFIASFGVMAFFMTPNASKYSSDALMDLAKATPHYYATYFTTHAVDPGLYALYAVVIILFSLPFLGLAILKFRGEDL